MNNNLIHYNDNSKPLIFLGSSVSMNKLTDVCDNFNIQIAGILDNDYWGVTKTVCEIPVIGSEEILKDPNLLLHYRNQYNFFCATNWLPMKDQISIRNAKKRKKLLNIINECQLSCISLIDSSSKISSYSRIGKGVFIDSFVLIEPNVEISDYSTIYAYAAIGHGTKVGNNSVIQRKCSIASDCNLEEEVYMGTAVNALKQKANFGKNTFIHEGIYIRRGTIQGEEVSMKGDNLRRVHGDYVD
jgi:acetyltransferase-like isoleucine patch superfamily enzyme